MESQYHTRLNIHTRDESTLLLLLPLLGLSPIIEDVRPQARKGNEHGLLRADSAAPLTGTGVNPHVEQSRSIAARQL